MKNIPSTTKQLSQAGFTLIELMVSLSLFIVVVVALIGSLYTVNSASRKVQAMRTVMDNINFAMETMGRTVRTSENITCSTSTVQNCPISGLPSYYIAMNSTLGEHRFIEYKWDTWPDSGNGRIERQSTGLVPNTTTLDPYDYIKDNTDVRPWVPITSPEIDIPKTDFGFYVDGAKPGDGKQPSVIIKFQGVATVVGSETIPFAIQTYLSQRTPETTP